MKGLSVVKNKHSVNKDTLRPRNRIHRPWKYLEQLLNISNKEAHHLWQVVNAAILMQIVEQGHLTIDGLCRMELHRKPSGKLSLRTVSYKYLTNLAEDKDDTWELKNIFSDYQIEILKAKYKGLLGAGTWIGFTDKVDERPND